MQHQKQLSAVLRIRLALIFITIILSVGSVQSMTLNFRNVSSSEEDSDSDNSAGNERRNLDDNEETRL